MLTRIFAAWDPQRGCQLFSTSCRKAKVLDTKLPCELEPDADVPSAGITGTGVVSADVAGARVGEGETGGASHQVGG